MRETTGIEFRPQVKLPETVGFYYARFIERTNLNEPIGLFPVQVLATQWGGLYVVIPGFVLKFNRDDFVWFGPAREVREVTP